MGAKLIPGTTINYADEKHAFTTFKNMIEISDGLVLSQVCAITGLSMFDVQNWVKRGYVARPINKKYYTKQFARILLINSLKDAMKIDEIGDILVYVNGDVEDESDDIVSEEELYNMFSAINYDVESIDSIEEALRNNLDDVNNKLASAMRVMIYAYHSSRLKKIAYEEYGVLKGETNEG
ncbi:MAG: DUF1836 domain-containing protein [Erysipelotrichaceae bacterium]|nr:DUF1836 domain-containing protein [Erysipelotrichaceae bacterium]